MWTSLRLENRSAIACFAPDMVATKFSLSVLFLDNIQWFELLDANVTHLPSALVIDAAQVLRLLQGTFYGTTDSNPNATPTNVQWSWQQMGEAEGQLTVYFSVSVVKLKYPFHLKEAVKEQVASKFQYLFLRPLTALWNCVSSSSNPALLNRLRKDWKSSPVEGGAQITSDAVELWTSLVSSEPAEPPSAVAQQAAPTTPAASSQSDKTTVNTPSMSLHFDLSASDELAPEPKRTSPAKRKSPDVPHPPPKKDKNKKPKFL